MGIAGISGISGITGCSEAYYFPPNLLPNLVTTHYSGFGEFKLTIKLYILVLGVECLLYIHNRFSVLDTQLYAWVTIMGRY